MAKKRVLIVSGAIILLCMIIISGLSVALFTDSKSVRNHLQAGDLEVELKRTYLEYSVLDANGKLAVTKIEADADFSGVNYENVFGIASKNLRIVPGSYFEADLEIRNVGNVAFTYNIGIKLIDKANALTEQLNVTITDSKGVSTEMTMSELAKGYTINAGEILANDDKAQTFTVRIDFIDSVDYNKNLAAGETPMDNDPAQTQIAVFDLVVSAVQATTP